jgi:peptidyl-prolyl cis-trans isomerase B (cyclophilin B)
VSDGQPPAWQQQYPPPQYPPQQWQPQGYGYPQPRNTNGFCIASLVCSLVGILLLFIGPVLGVIFGWVGLRQTARLGEQGRGLAIAGVVIGVLVLVINVVAVVAWSSGGDPAISNGVTV